MLAAGLLALFVVLCYNVYLRLAAYGWSLRVVAWLAVATEAVAAASGLVGGAPAAAACVVAAFAANWVESVLGATLQDDVPWLTNDVVNVINTAVGAALAVLLGAAGGAI